MSENPTMTARPMREHIAEEIRVLLARRRMSASELARRIGQTQPYLSRRLTGDVALDVDDLASIAAALDVPPAALFGAAVSASNTHELPTGSRKARSKRPTTPRHDGRPSNVPLSARRPMVSPLYRTGQIGHIAH